MKTILRYPRTISEIHRLINFLDLKMQDINDNKTPKNKSREWMRICQATNDIRDNASKLLERPNNNHDINFNNDIHHRILNDLEKWMKINKIPLW